MWAAVRQCGAWLLFLQLSSGRAEGTATSRDKTSSLRVVQYLYHIFAVYMTAYLQSGADSVRSVVGIGKLMVLCMPPYYEIATDASTPYPATDQREFGLVV